MGARDLYVIVKQIQKEKTKEERQPMFIDWTNQY